MVSNPLTHSVVIMRDSYDETTYPINVMPHADVGEIALDNPEEMEIVVEVYNLALNINDQLLKYRASESVNNAAYSC